MCSVEGIFVFGTHMEIMCEVDVAVGCVLANISTNVSLQYPYRMMAVTFMCNVAAILLSDVYQ